ncbi:Piwi-domain-containing protein [Atractiella rhizophila]|nr:Piwi-domain-containing protein [Atractiella rhizophila]
MSHQLQLARRPGLGVKGTRINNVTVNAFKVKRPTGTVHHYDVTIVDDRGRGDLPAALGRRLFGELEAGRAFGNAAVAFDGKKNMYANKEIGELAGAGSAREVDLNEDGRTKRFKVKFQYVAPIDLRVLVQTQGVQPADMQRAINALQMVILHSPMMKYVSVRTKFFPDPVSSESTGSLGGCLEIWRGYSVSLRPTPGGLILNVDTTSIPLLRQGNLSQVCQAYLQEKYRNAAPRLDNMTGPQKVELGRFLRGVKIRTSGYVQTRSYTIKGLGDSASKILFEHNGRKINVQTYFRQNYQLNLQQPNLPCVKVSAAAFLPMEVCQIQPKQKWGKKLTPEQTKDALNFIKKAPNVRMGDIKGGLQFLFPTTGPSPRSWGMDVESRDLMKVQARVLPPPTLNQTSGNRPFKPTPGAWEIKGKKFEVGSAIKHWLAIVFGGPRQMVEIQQSTALADLRRACADCGIQFHSPAAPALVHFSDRQQINPVTLKQFLMKASPGQKTDLIVCFLGPGTPDSTYAAIKWMTDIDLGIASQCLDMKKSKKWGRQYWENLALKINVKLGGRNHSVHSSSLPQVFQKEPTIIFGADVNHPSPDSSAPSIVGVVATMDKTFSQYSTAIGVQTSRVEMMEDLATFVKDLVLQFKAKLNIFPKRLLFYRDGISEGQFPICFEQEIPKVVLGCQLADPACRPRITFIVVGKRHNFRFSAQAPDGDRSGNLKPGTVVDQGVISTSEWDFYLNSHAGLLGTSKSSHYTILVDENNLSADDVEGLSYNLTYSYARSTRSVSIPPPAYYAHHVCTRAKLLLSHATGTGDTESVATSGDRSLEEGRMLQQYRGKLKQVHDDIRRGQKLYFM